MRLTAFILLLLGILFNEWVIISLFSYDDSISRMDIKWAIWLTQLGCFLLALFVFKVRKQLVWRERITSAWIFSISVLFGLFFAELLVRIIQPTPGGFPKGSLLFEPDSILGWRFVPNIQTDVVWGNEAHAWVEINADGFREENELSESEVFVFGDSFVSALEVDANQRFTELAETATHKRLYNFGVNGYGPVQYGLLAEQIFQKVKPQLAVFVLYVRNDVYDASGVFDWTHGLKRPIINENKIIYPKNQLDEEVKRNQKRYLYQSKIRPEDSHLYNLIQVAYQRLNAEQKALRIPPELDLARIERSDTMKIALNATQQSLQYLKRVLDTYHIQAHFLIAPSHVQVYPQIWDSYLKENDLPKEAYNLYLINKEIAQLLDSLSLPYTDLTPIFVEKAKKSTKSLYFEQNHHWTPEAHLIVSDVLKRIMHQTFPK